MTLIVKEITNDMLVSCGNEYRTAFLDNFTKTTGRSCAEAKTCKLKGNQ